MLRKRDILFPKRKNEEQRTEKCSKNNYMIKFSFVRLPKYFVKVVLAWRAKTLNLFPAILANADAFPAVAFLTNRKVRVETGTTGNTSVFAGYDSPTR